MAARVKAEELLSEQSIPLGAVFGAAAAVIAAGVWALVTVATEYQIGWMAIGVGFLVGFAVRIGGKGVQPVYGVIGAGLALFGCLLGNLLSMTYFLALNEEVPYGEALVALNPALAVEIMTLTFDPMDLLFYGLAIFCGYKYAFRRA